MVWQKVQEFRYERRCAAYTAPADQIVYVEDALKTESRNPPTPQSQFVPTLGGRQPVAVAIAPACWESYRALKPPARSASIATLFLHDRFRPDGSRRLVCLEFDGWAGLEAWQFSFLIRERRGPSGSVGHVALNLRPGAKPGALIFRAGQRDPSNPSHFTIGYDLDGLSGTIDGWLTDQDDIKLQLRDGPAK